MFQDFQAKPLMRKNIFLNPNTKFYLLNKDFRWKDKIFLTIKSTFSKGKQRIWNKYQQRIFPSNNDKKGIFSFKIKKKLKGFNFFRTNEYFQ